MGVKRIRLTDKQCTIFMKDIIDFGYNVTFEEIRDLANKVADGEDVSQDIVGLILCKQIDEATSLIMKSGR